MGVATDFGGNSVFLLSSLTLSQTLSHVSLIDLLFIDEEIEAQGNDSHSVTASFGTQLSVSQPLQLDFNTSSFAVSGKSVVLLTECRAGIRKSGFFLALQSVNFSEL